MFVCSGVLFLVGVAPRLPSRPSPAAFDRLQTLTVTPALPFTVPPLHRPRCTACRYDTRKDIKFAKDAPVIGLVLQRSHLVTGDHGHYDGVVSELESRGAKVVPVFAGECWCCCCL